MVDGHGAVHSLCRGAPACMNDMGSNKSFFCDSMCFNVGSCA
jgi:hypothetical protein